MLAHPDLFDAVFTIGYGLILLAGGVLIRKWGRQVLDYAVEKARLVEQAKSYRPMPPREPTVPNVLHYPAPPEPDPEPSPLALLNRRWKYTSMATAASRLQEPPRPFRLRERPSKLPRGNYFEEPTPRRENERETVAAAKAYQAEPESPMEKRPGPLQGLIARADPPDQGPFETEAWTSAHWSDCTRSVKSPESLPGFGWATPEQKDWIQELKQQLIDRGEAVCLEGGAEWAHPEYQAQFGELDLLVWNAARTGMSMFDFISMMQWEKENGCGRGLFDTGGNFNYRGGPGLL